MLEEQEFFWETTPQEKKNTEAANKLLSMFHDSGVFSDRLKTKVYLVCSRALDNNIKKEDKQQEIWNQFESIFNVYSIFSDDFVVECKSIFIEVLN